MILTCPSCATQYVVKDQAIPVGGRKVRCAACKHKWFEEGEVAVTAGAEAGGEPKDAAARDDGESTVVSDSERPPEPPAAPPPPDERRWEAVEPVAGLAPLPPQSIAEPEPDGQASADEEFEPFYDHEPIEQPMRRWPWLLAVVLLVALAAIAFSLVAPAELRQRLGLASADGSELEIVLTTRNRQALASGNDLFTVSGRIINSTDDKQTVPPLYAELLDASRQKVVYRWTISPPAASLAPGTSASFNSAQLGVPEEGRYLRMRLGGPDA